MFPIELADRVIDQFWRREQRTRALPTRLVCYVLLVLCLFPDESYRPALKILLGTFGRTQRVRGAHERVEDWAPNQWNQSFAL
jgi:hypothetical protein